MENVRRLFASYIEDFGEYRYLYSEVFVENTLPKKMLDSKMAEFRRLYYELQLYVPNNDSNQSLLKYINLMWIELSYISDYYDYGRSKGYINPSKMNLKMTNYEKFPSNYLDKLILKASTSGSEYFKIEWDKAKNGK